MKTKLLIIGAGPAGMTAAIYAKRAGIDFILLEKYIPGGNLVNAYEIENYPGFAKIFGPDLALNMQNQLTDLNIDITFDEITNISKNTNNSYIAKGLNETYEAEYIILALGTKPRKLEIADEDRFLGRGISYCATCDGAFFKNKDVIVVGGGNSAINEALYLSNIVKNVTIITRSTFRADKEDLIKLESKNNAKLQPNCKITKLIGKNKLEQVELTNTISNETKVIDFDGIFVYIGQEPPTNFLQNLNILNKFGFIEVNNSFETTQKNIFAIGDCINKEVRQIVTAISDAVIAVTEIKNKLK